MKTNRMYQRGIAALAGLLILALGGCTDPFIPGDKDTAGETIPPGMGLARISLDLGGARTAVPDIGVYYFTLKFTAPGQTGIDETLSPGTSSLTVVLAPATWNLEVKGYAEDTHTTLKLSGNISVPITAGTAANFSVYLSPALSAGGLGTLEYTIDLSALPGIRAWFGLYPLEVVGTSANPAISREYDISTSAGTAAASVTLASLPQGTYRAVIDLYDSANNKAAVRTEVVHIYDDLVTPLNRVFTAANFAACPPVVGDGASTLAAKLDAALASVDAEVCTIVLTGTETDLTGFTPRTFNITGNKNRTLIIRGGGAEVQVLGTGTPLFTLEAASGSTLSLELRDITLRGRPGNSVPVVRVNPRGTLSMKTGSRITGNTSSSSSGGGVYVMQGTFSMSGGAVSGNTSSSSSGGGVYVMQGTFSMSGGAVSGNTSSSSGGGVYVNGGTFSMSGGAVSGNTSSSSSGGGVYVYSGTFSMSGGAVSGNTTSSGGGGVYVFQGTFSMSGGAVSGNTSSSSSGGGVYVNGGTFSMSGGATVSGNNLSNANGYGKEVLVYGGTFKLSGDAMPERVFLYDTSKFITISGPLSGGPIPIDLGITTSVPLENYVSAQILRLDSSYNAGNMAELKTHFSLGNSKYTSSPYTEAPITGYTIDNNGYFVEVTAP